MSDFDVSALRDEFPIARRLVYLNTGTAGVCPLSVAAELWRSIRAFELEGETGWGAASARMNEGRSRLAAHLGAEPDEIALTRNATDGVNFVVEGVDWRDGDQVLLSAEEHPAMQFPWTHLTQRKRVGLKRFALGMSADETLRNLRAAWAPRTRLVATSHVSSVTGKRVPIAAIREECRSRGALLQVDGAQAVGQFPIDLHALDVDFYTGNVHKWLHGPKGTGFFYVARSRVADLTPTYVGADSGSIAANGRFTPNATARRFEYGTRDFGRYGGLIPLFDWYDRVDFGNIWRRMQHLTAYVKDGLKSLDGVRIHTPEPWEESSALTTFSVPGVSGGRIVGELRDRHRIYLRVVPEVDGIRVSTALFNTEGDLDRLIGALRPYL